MARLWQKDYSLDTLMQHFTVRNDYVLDRDLVIADVLGSVAHARGLERIGILSSQELETLEKGLCSVAAASMEGTFDIREEDEDCHTAIEGFLTAQCGPVGKKIHTGRSRNDQVQTALRIYMREADLRIVHEALSFADRLLSKAVEYEMVPMPGRTHTQLAMPSSLGLWFSSFACQLVDECRLLMGVYGILDQCPLGSAASYGVPIPLDRAYTSSQLGFSKVQKNVLYANNSRGCFEAMLLDGCSYLCSLSCKMAQDLILFTLPELGYFSLPRELTTGSSIMPQKKNPDGLELVRSRSALVSSCSSLVKDITRSLVSGYNRDFQDTKEPLLTGLSTTCSILAIMGRMVDGLEVHEDRLREGMRPEIYATDKVFDSVLSGSNFRDSYRAVGLDLDSVDGRDADAALARRTSLGTSGDLRLGDDVETVVSFMKEVELELDRLQEVYRALVDVPVRVVSW